MRIEKIPIFVGKQYLPMSYVELAKLEVLNAVSNIQTQEELDDFKNMLAHYFAAKAQKAIDALWDEGKIGEDTIEEWGKEHLRTPYRYAGNRS